MYTGRVLIQQSSYADTLIRLKFSFAFETQKDFFQGALSVLAGVAHAEELVNLVILGSWAVFELAGSGAAHWESLLWYFALLYFCIGNVTHAFKKKKKK